MTPAVGRSTPVNRFALTRAGYGLLQLACAPALFRGADRSAARAALRVLGLRQLVQAAATVSAPTPGVLGLGTGVDLLHAASMAALAGVSRRYRGVALPETLAATALALAGTVAAGQAARQARVLTVPQPASQSR
ncbi:hypothetical protein ACEZCY_29665 [Streptacidiphilus sp. N1-12]|uniref:Uncharacterized protein n=2 Tax=Streptacidiphilus alkalitolerans TaxID=3342712 RepID=A0ABV6WNQ7_9ACTN